MSDLPTNVQASHAYNPLLEAFSSENKHFPPNFTSKHADRLIRDVNPTFNREHYIEAQAPSIEEGVEALLWTCHVLASLSGWWHNKVEDNKLELKQRNFGEVIALCHSELSEALEGGRKSLMSDKIPEFTAVEEEVADTLIRLADFAGALNLRIGMAIIAKLKYNAQREDHKMDNRMADGGKKF